MRKYDKAILDAITEGVQRGAVLGQESERRRIRPAVEAAREALDLGHPADALDLLRDTLKFIDDPSFIPGAPS